MFSEWAPTVGSYGKIGMPILVPGTDIRYRYPYPRVESRVSTTRVWYRVWVVIIDYQASDTRITSARERIEQSNQHLVCAMR